MTLNKVRLKEVSLVARALYANDIDYLRTVNANISTALDLQVGVATQLSENAVAYKVIDDGGALIGFFSTVRGSKEVRVFFIKKSARIPQYIAAFWVIVSQTLFGEIYESVSDNNVVNISDYLKNNFSILAPNSGYGKQLIF